MKKIAIIGAGMIGRAWAIVFAKKFKQVVLYDTDHKAIENSILQLSITTQELYKLGLLNDEPNIFIKKISVTNNLKKAIENVDYIQECGPENLEIKKDIFSKLDSIVDKSVAIGSSTSGIKASIFSEGLNHPERFLVVHPVNPPSLVPLVEIVPSEFTDKKIVEFVSGLMNKIEQKPIVVKKEIDGFILNRLQGALLNEAFKLVSMGYVDSYDLDKTVKYGLGLRWSFMGPMETIDLNAPGGISDYAKRYGPIYQNVASELEVKEWNESFYHKVEFEQRQIRSLDDNISRQKWRDKRLMALAKHKKESDKLFGE
ncbi:MAG: 3-hydroxyacyl-CoA dehydrogenase [Rhodospirillaceae bacterium]|nr:3-hydroxyacyl-CoA dehydrogenase [Rhodospirillaceae bacterium]|tara:strand:+ start:1296 stop:2237 length:942 start_codon:yes stop_codon:yes gene_type:complete